MNKESLQIIQDKIADILNNTNIDIIDKVELLINLHFFLEDYDENIEVLKQYRLRKEKEK